MKDLALANTKKYYVYILTNYTNSVLYTGITNDLTRRIFEHKNAVETFSSKYRLYKLVWFKEFDSPLDAIRTEKRIKGWIRLKKIMLINKTNPNWKNLIY